MVELKNVYVIEFYDNLGNFAYIDGVFKSRQQAERVITQTNKADQNITGTVHKRQLT